MIITEEAYLEHFGKKGMKWGVRKSQGHPDVGNRKRNRRGGTPQQKRTGTKKFVRNLAIGSALGVAGGLAVGAMLKSRGKIPVRSIPKVDLNTVFSAKLPNGKVNSYGKFAEEAMRKAGAFGSIPLGPVGSTSIARLGGAIPIPRR